MKKTILTISLFGTMLCLNAQSVNMASMDLTAERTAVNTVLDKFQTTTETDTLAGVIKYE